MENCQKFDNTLFSILQECNGLPLFLDTIFGFLNRRTDFYNVAADSSTPVGLPEGWAEEYVRRAFFKWKAKHNHTENANAPSGEIHKVPEPIAEVQVSSTTEQEVSIEKKNNDSVQQSTNNKVFTSSESYNGAVFEKYSWSQSINEIDISITVPEKTTTKQLSVNILSKRISVKLKNSGEILVEGELCQKIKHQDAIWSLDERKLSIHLEKCSEVWWNCLTLNEPTLDVTKLDCSRPYEELSEEAQAKIDELTWNQERKRLGLPTSDELVMQERLKKAWDAPGSPFNGPFDPNAVILN